ncbi:MAG TPA: 3-oxoacyl-[acyl-carrier-protein] synthase III C-terminal domain-containing protein, partial [Cryptosporangiaceae bacterium]|nr:3-oxoacyl-[acyl-carrier-protein] synthase III C-terminal domain-containing protein [Cryptosporangiaceae bacterium]
PDTLDQQVVWDGFFAEHFAGSRLARRVFASSGVRRRHGVANPLVDDVSAWSTEARMQRYLAEALPLGKDAAAAALDDAGLAATDLGLFAVVSCTGYATPGLDIRLSCDLGMSADLQRLMIGHMGCYAALPGLGAVGDYVVARGRPALLLCLELTSLHVQPPTTDPQQVVAHALFSDAAAAVVVAPGSSASAGAAGWAAAGLEVVDVAAVTDVISADHMTWDVTDLGFRMGLSPRVPDVLAEHIQPAVEALLGRHGLNVPDIAGWAVHPGGPRILDVAAEQLGLPEDALDASRHVLAEHGNCSSVTVLLVIDELARRGVPGPDGHLVALAFGPGLTLYATLLRQVGGPP